MVTSPAAQGKKRFKFICNCNIFHTFLKVVRRSTAPLKTQLTLLTSLLINRHGRAVAKVNPLQGRPSLRLTRPRECECYVPVGLLSNRSRSVVGAHGTTRNLSNQLAKAERLRLRPPKSCFEPAVLLRVRTRFVLVQRPILDATGRIELHTRRAQRVVWTTISDGAGASTGETVLSTIWSTGLRIDWPASFDCSRFRPTCGFYLSA
jgi:hypothetical protein